MSKRLSRKEIKHDIREDQVRVGIEAIFDWVSQNARVVAAIGAGVLVLVLAVIGIRYFLEQRHDEASEALGRAIAAAQAPVVEEGAEPDRTMAPSFPSEQTKRARARELLEGVIEDYGNTVAADVAKVYLARILYEQGQADEARRLWGEFLEEHPGHMLAASVRVNLLEQDRAAGKAEAVVEELRAWLGSEKPSLPTDVLLYELGRSLEELDRADEARDTYRRLADEYPDSPYARDAQAKLQELGPTSA
jgi:tetratricopeptide (TPR) repeat protein